MSEASTSLRARGFDRLSQNGFFIRAASCSSSLIRTEIVNDLVTVFESELVCDAVCHMRSKCIRRVPVVDANNHPLGVLTACDVTEFLAEELTEVARIVPRQIKLEHATRNPMAK